MAITVRVPTPLRKLVGDKELIEVEGGKLNEIIDNLEAEYPGVKNKLCDDDGNLRRFVNIYVNGEDIRFLSGLETEIPEGHEVSIVPAIAGG